MTNNTNGLVAGLRDLADYLEANPDAPRFAVVVSSFSHMHDLTVPDAIRLLGPESTFDNSSARAFIVRREFGPIMLDIEFKRPEAATMPLPEGAAEAFGALKDA